MIKTNYVSLPITLEDVLDDKKFRLPVFQRNVVWTKARRKEFIINVRNGEPFGVILVQQNEGRYELIDGLQRITSLRSYCENKFEYLDEKDLNYDLVKKIVEANLDAQGLPHDDNYIESISRRVQVKIYDCLKNNLSRTKIMKALVDEFSFSNSDEVIDALEFLCDDFKESTDISGISILAINYTGPSENIPNVFYNLNTGGVALSKYETLAPLWADTKFKISDNQILSLVEKKYLDLQDESNLEVDFNADDMKENGISLFEYCYALSGIMRNKDNGFDKLFPDNSKSTDPIGFEILSLLFGKKVNEAEKLKKILERKTPEYLCNIKKIIVDALTACKGALENVINGYTEKSLCSESMYLMYHILVSYIWEYYFIDPDLDKIELKKDTLSLKDFKKYTQLHYVKDCISDYWKINRQVSDLDREIHNAESRRKYWHSISKEDWTLALDTFMLSQMDVSKTIPQKNKIFLNYLNKLKLIKQPEYNLYFKKDYDGMKNEIDFEHITPQKILTSGIKDLSTSKQKRYPISAVGNLCYLSAKDNRSKRDKTIYENMKDRPSYVQDRNYLNFIDYPMEDELSFIHLNNVQFRAGYESFVSKRQDSLKNAFLKLVKDF